MTNANEFNNYFKTLAANQTKSAELYGAYLSGMATRTNEVFTTMTEDARAHFEGLTKVGSFNDAIQAGVAYDSNVRGKLKELYDNNVDATKTFAADIAKVYTPANTEEAA